MRNPDQDAELEKEIVARLGGWKTFYNLSRVTHYTVSLTGIVVAGLAAAGKLDPYSAIASGVCVGILGLNPKGGYAKFTRSWRLLNAARLRFKYGESTRAELLASYEAAEALISDAERREESPPPGSGATPAAPSH
ncbi:MAG TPA: hypothetical protein VJB57_20495 [Dehalococcoidia bacterium]|nr:hypothetical protein [Dehalococcoidia bacterium]